MIRGVEREARAGIAEEGARAWSPLVEDIAREEDNCANATRDIYIIHKIKFER